MKQKTPTKYPFDQWFDGSIWELRRGEDFDCKTDSLQAYLHQTCYRRGITLRTKARSSQVLVIQAVLPIASPAY